MLGAHKSEKPAGWTPRYYRIHFSAKRKFGAVIPAEEEEEKPPAAAAAAAADDDDTVKRPRVESSSSSASAKDEDASTGGLYDLCAFGAAYRAEIAAAVAAKAEK
jgi:hypothetical protein